MTKFVATAHVDIQAAPEDVWEVLTLPGSRPDLNFGTEVESEWRVGAPIVWKGEWNGTAFEDHGTILELEPGRILRVTHNSGNAPDAGADAHEVSYRLEDLGPVTRLTITQTGNADQASADHSSDTWAAMLETVKQVAEQPGSLG